MHCFQPTPHLIRSLGERHREEERERRRATEGERELESPLVWRPRLSLAVRHAGSQGATATADCALAKVTVARATIELDHI